MTKPALGRGLAALLPTSRATSTASADPAPESVDGLREVPLERIRPNPRQPRHHIDEQGLYELEASIRAQGVLQPILVRPLKDGYELIAGERRYRAAKRAGLKAVPAVVRQLDERFVLETALVENLQREDLDPIDEALGYQALLEDLAYTQEKIAERVGKERSTVANALRLLTLPQAVQDLVSRGTLSAGHARALLPLPAPEEIETAAKYVSTMGFSVRKTEAFVARKLKRRVQARQRLVKVSAAKASAGAAAFADIEASLRRRFATQVRIVPQGTGGKVEFEYYSQAELERLLELWGTL
jgi:ParB family chromosome partitioning protein